MGTSSRLTVAVCAIAALFSLCLAALAFRYFAQPGFFPTAAPPSFVASGLVASFAGAGIALYLRLHGGYRARRIAAFALAGALVTLLLFPPILLEYRTDGHFAGVRFFGHHWFNMSPVTAYGTVCFGAPGPPPVSTSLPRVCIPIFAGQVLSLVGLFTLFGFTRSRA